MTKRS